MSLAFGTETGSLTNHILSANQANIAPVLGMGATLIGWSDRYAATVAAHEDGILTVQEDRAERTDKNGASDLQDYAYTANPEGATHHFRLDDSGKWQAVEFHEHTQRWAAKESGYALRLGNRDHYYDFSF